MKTTMLELLTWAYRDELVKRDAQGFGDGWAGVEAAGEGRYFDGDAPVRAPAALGAPHPDAETVDRAVKALQPVAAAFDAQGARAAAQVLLGAMAGGVTPADMVSAMTARIDPRGLLQSAALGVIRPPGPETWSFEPASFGRDGKPVECGVVWRRETVRIGGKTARPRTLVSGWCDVAMLPRPYDVMRERLRWSVVVDALERLVVALSGRLVLWRIDGIGAAREPWRGDLHRPYPGRLLADLRAEAGQSRERPSQPVARPVRGRAAVLQKNRVHAHSGA